MAPGARTGGARSAGGLASGASSAPKAPVAGKRQRATAGAGGGSPAKSRRAERVPLAEDEIARKGVCKRDFIVELRRMFPGAFASGAEAEGEVLDACRLYVDEFSMRANHLTNEKTLTSDDGAEIDLSDTTVDDWMRRITRPTNVMLRNSGARTAVLLMDKYLHVPECKTIVQKKRNEDAKEALKRKDTGADDESAETAEEGEGGAEGADASGKAKPEPYKWDGVSNILLPNGDAPSEQRHAKRIPPWSQLRADPAARARLYREMRLLLPYYVDPLPGQVVVLDGGLRGGRGGRANAVVQDKDDDDGLPLEPVYLLWARRPGSKKEGDAKKRCKMRKYDGFRNDVGESEILAFRYAETFASEEALAPHRRALIHPQASEEETARELESGWRERVGPTIFYSTDSDAVLLGLLYAPRRWASDVGRRGTATYLGGITLINDLPERHSWDYLRSSSVPEPTPPSLGLSQDLGLWGDDDADDFGGGGGAVGSSSSLSSSSRRGGRPSAGCRLIDVDALAGAVLEALAKDEGYDSPERAHAALASFFLLYAVLGCDYNDALHAVTHATGMRAFLDTFDPLSPWVSRAVPMPLPAGAEAEGEGDREGTSAAAGVVEDLDWIPHARAWVAWLHRAYELAYANKRRFAKEVDAKLASGEVLRAPVRTEDLVRLVSDPAQTGARYLSPGDLVNRASRCLWYLHYCHRRKDVLAPEETGYRRVVDPQTGEKRLEFA